MLHRAVEAGPDPPSRSAASCLLAAAASCCVSGWDSGNHDQGWHEAEVPPLLREVTIASVFLIKEQEKVSFCSKWLARTPASQVRVSCPWSQLGPVPALFFSPSRCSVHTAPLFPFKPPLHQLFAWGDISGKCEEMAAEPKS